MKERSVLTRKAAVIPLTMLCCLLWGSAFPCIKLGYGYSGIGSDDTASQILYAGLRFALAGVLALIMGSLTARKPLIPRRKAVPKIVMLSLFQTILQYTFFYIGLARSTGMKSSVITASNVFLSILVASLIFRTEKLTFRKILGCAVGFSGVVLINLSGIGGGFRLTGEGFVFLSALSYAFSAALIKRFSAEEDPVMLSGWQFIIGGTFMTVLGLVLGGRIGTVDLRGAAMLVYLAIVSAAAFSIWGTLLKHNPVSMISVFGFMNPVFGVILSFLLLSERSEAGPLRVVAALGLVALGIVIVNYTPKIMRREKTAL
ncbi:DMT family transporter [Ruminococcus flavefaciens]|uniref:Drug/metabolite transporter (DMT)-like permease n=1 Tax=Ruminococcus flavefaciens TaxID=1265 RepID=A0A315XYL4_RUMFL|nr:DMT family transporter [Ruminococcus flavefaciens]PWJ10801.1 drug/metabolite transporter (DMT)-like permease [Ruminococcus flavefaciens]SSA51377.1 Permease of the drug/metabolite transporter (DMT) superfamily [Ruminococcus flavefaciens]